MSNRNPGCGCVTLVGGLLLASSASAGYFYLRGNLPWQNFTAYRATGVIPYETVLIAHVSTEAKLWSQLSKMGTPETRALIRDGIEDFPESKVILSEEVQSWLDGVTLAMVAVNDEPQLLLVGGIKDKIKAWQYQRQLQKQSSQEVTESDYKKVKIYQVVSSNKQPIYFAILRDYLVAGEQIQVVERAIDTHQGAAAFQDRQGLKAFLGEIKFKNLLAQVYVDDLVDLCETVEDLSPEQKNALDKISKFTGGVGVINEGLHLQTVVNQDPQTLTKLPSRVDNKIIGSLPENTWLLLHGTNLNNEWENFVTQAQHFPEAQQVVDQIRAVFAQLSIDVDREIYGWMDGDYAIALTTNNERFQTFGIAGVIILETSDPQTANASLERVSQWANQSQFIYVNQTEEFTEWSSYTQPLLSYGWLAKNSLAFTIGSPFQEVKDVKSNNSLRQNPTYKERIAILPKSGSSYFYLDMEPLVKQLNSYGSPIPPDLQAAITAIDGIVGNLRVEKSTTRSDLVIFIPQNP